VLVTNTQFAGKYPLLSDVIIQSGVSYDQVIQHMANMTETEWREMARLNGVTIDEFVADAEKAIDAFESLYKNMAENVKKERVKCFYKRPDWKEGIPVEVDFNLKEITLHKGYYPSKLRDLPADAILIDGNGKHIFKR
jgi:hypothetical protein